MYALFLITGVLIGFVISWAFMLMADVNSVHFVDVLDALYELFRRDPLQKKKGQFDKIQQLCLEALVDYFDSGDPKKLLEHNRHYMEAIVFAEPGSAWLQSLDGRISRLKEYQDSLGAG